MRAVLLCTFLLVVVLPLSLSLVRWDEFVSCLQTRFKRNFLLDRHVVCATRKMFVNYRRSLYCRHCDKYFHCQGNYEAVYHCAQDPKAYRAAEAISHCRELAQGGGLTQENVIYNEVNDFGRKGGDCVREYLEKNERCRYDPYTTACNTTWLTN